MLSKDDRKKTKNLCFYLIKPGLQRANINTLTVNVIYFSLEGIWLRLEVCTGTWVHAQHTRMSWNAARAGRKRG